ncbi:putative ABC transporter ATP-binding protein [Phycisphaerae bacterium RAS1]|nr:putative ABC transporter ATP-binding protein [Phycisphaerae bacterium RAS1]
MLHDTKDIVISVRDLAVRFDKPGGGAVTVLDGISFDVYRGETLVIMGGSGGGKSTLLNAMIGEVQADEGQITYHLPEIGRVDFASASDATRDRVRKRFGILFQSGALFSSMTVAQNIALPLTEHSHVDRAIIDIVVAMKLQQVHMLPHRDKMPSQLSGGQKKRVGLARALALDPTILYYDEPSAGLDPVTSTAIDELIMDLSRKLKVTSVVVTHEMDSAFRVADRMLMLSAGRVLRLGPVVDFERIRRADPKWMTSDDDRLLHQFLNGAATGPLTDAEGTSEYEKVLLESTVRSRG